MKRQAVVLLLGLFMIVSRANKNLDHGVSNQQIPESYPVPINIEAKKNSKLQVSIKSLNLEQSTELDSEDNLPAFYAQHKTEIGKSNKATVQFTADSPVNLERYLKLIKSARDTGLKTFYLADLSGEKRILVKNLADQKEEIFPPDTEKFRSLILVVDWDKNRKIKLNHEEEGNIEDLSSLEKRLTEVFYYRSKDPSAFREGTNQAETSVYVKIPADITSFDENYKRLFETLRKAGASPIGIQVRK